MSGPGGSVDLAPRSVRPDPTDRLRPGAGSSSGGYSAFSVRISSVSRGTTSKRSPTIP